VGLESVRDNLGHSSIAVSSLYIDTALEEQHSQTEAFIEGGWGSEQEKMAKA
jgi:hypothetical protein